jgi:hypothetical protein
MKKPIGLLLLSLTLAQFAHGQSVPESTSTDQQLTELMGKVTDLEHENLKKSQLKLTGYIQAQWQRADSQGISSFAGGDFPTASDNRFMIRRGRVKLDYSRTNEDGDILTQGIVQIDFTQNGLALRDAYINILDPHTKWIGLKVGAMDRPFGYEVTYSSGLRETPERARMSQTLFPGEKDLGAQIYVMPNKTSRYRFFKLEAGIYNGTGVLNNEFDKYKDFISRLSFYKNNSDETIRYSGGVSYFNGGHKNSTKYIDDLLTKTDGSSYWAISDSSASNIDRKAKQVYYGADAQVSIKWAGGLTTLRGEYITGIQGGTDKSTASPRVPVTGNMYERNFNGAYFYLVQNILDSRHNVVVKYDWYDPNTKVKESEIGPGLTAADIKYTTLGLGYFFNYDQNWKFLLYYDIVKNDPTHLTNYGSDLKDNVLTVRVQYKF